MTDKNESWVGRVVKARINYLQRGVTNSIWYAADTERSYMPLETVEMSIQDFRPAKDDVSLDRQGFALIEHETAVRNFRDPEEVRHVYGAELERLLMEVTRATKVIVQPGGVVRLSERSKEFGAPGTTYPGRYAHCDYSDESGPQTARLSFPPDQAAEAERRMKGRFAIYNLWRAISEPPQDSPLAVCDARSVDPGDTLVSYAVVGRAGGQEIKVQTNMFQHNPKHRWCFFTDMTRDEVLIFRGFDSDPARSQRVPHTAFDDPSVPQDAPARENVDIRAIAFFDD